LFKFKTACKAATCFHFHHNGSGDNWKTQNEPDCVLCLSPEALPSQCNSTLQPIMMFPSVLVIVQPSYLYLAP